MMITSGLENSAVYRLKKTWKNVSRKSMNTFQELRKLNSTKGNYKELRNAIHGSNPPLIPFLGMYLSDLTFVEGKKKKFYKIFFHFFNLFLNQTVIWIM
jgi:hypothetical protein